MLVRQAFTSMTTSRGPFFQQLRPFASMDSTRIQQLASNVQQLDKLAPRFDFDQSTKANGIHSLNKIVSKFCDLAKDAQPGDQRFADLDTLSKTLIHMQQLMIQVADRTLEYNGLSEVDKQVFTSIYSSFKKADSLPIFTSLGPFWLRDYFKTDGLVSPKTVASVMEKTAIQSAELMQQSKDNIIAVNIRRSCDWRIDVRDTESPASVEHVPGGREVDGEIECLLFKPDDVRDDGKIILFSHGGGFVSMSPEVYVPLLDRWSRTLGVCILCPNYRKAPTFRYPAGLQDILDVYLFLTSGTRQVRDVIGFDASKVLLAGDSAGANLSTALTFALTSINDHDGDGRKNHKVQMPIALALQYPYSSPCWTAYPSILLILLDTLISAPAYASLVPAYVQTNPATDIQWYRNEKDKEKVIQQLANRMRDPLFNNNAFHDWQSVRSIPLHVLVCEFDPLLDQGIAVASNWKSGGGHAEVQVCRDMPHGCFMATDVTQIANEEKQLLSSLDRLLKIDDAKINSKL